MTKSAPWSIETRSPAGVVWDRILRDSNGDPIATLLAAGWKEEEALEHARLIGAAPELYEALDELLTVYQHGECEVAHPDEAEEKARAALAKADGQEPR